MKNQYLSQLNMSLKLEQLEIIINKRQLKKNYDKMQENERYYRKKIVPKQGYKGIIISPCSHSLFYLI